jgi:multiple sugar transport system substrate-binding protein
MSLFTRRRILGTGAAVAGASLAPSILSRRARAYEPVFTPESGAELRVLRWSQFVQGDRDLWELNTRAFTEATGIPIRTDWESWEDVRPKSAVAANVGQGPDIIIGWFDDPHIYPDRLVRVDDLAGYLGDKYDGWYDVCRFYATREGEWIALPLGAPAATVNYRISWMQEAGFETFPTDMDGFLRLSQELARQGRPPGYALGNAVGDGNGWTHWLVWAFGGKMVDEDNVVAINSPETVQALEFVRELYQTFIPGTTAWLDPHNNRAFLAGQVSHTNNGISIYYAAKNSDDPAVRAIADDMDHAPFPIGPVGESSELYLFTQAMIFDYSPYPNAAKEYLRFMWEQEQYGPWMEAAIGYVSHPLRAYKDNPIWTVDPKHTPYRDALERMWPHSHAGSLGYASAAVMADYVMVNMVAQAATGELNPQEAAAEAERRANRYYKV